MPSLQEDQRRPADERKSSTQPVGTARSRPVAAGNAKISPSCHCETSPQTGRGNPYSYCLLPQGERIATSAPPPRNDNIGSFPFIGRTAECRPYAANLRVPAVGDAFPCKRMRPADERKPVDDPGNTSSGASRHLPLKGKALATPSTLTTDHWQQLIHGKKIILSCGRL